MISFAFIFLYVFFVIISLIFCSTIYFIADADIGDDAGKACEGQYDVIFFLSKR